MHVNRVHDELHRLRHLCRSVTAFSFLWFRNSELNRMLDGVFGLAPHLQAIGIVGGVLRFE